MRARLGGIVGGEQADAEIGLADAAAGVDPRPEREAEIGAARIAGQPRCLDQRRQPDVAPGRHHLEPLRDEGAVEPLELRDIGDGAECHDVEQIEQLRLGAPAREPAARAQGADQRGAEQEGDADRGEMAMRGALALVEPVGVDDRMGDGKRGRAFVVIDDDHVEPGVARRLQGLERQRAAIDGDDQPRAALGEPDQRIGGRAIAFEQPVGDIIARRQPEIAQQPDQQRRRRRPVDVIVAEDRHRLLRDDRHRRGAPRRGPCRERWRDRA